MTPERATLPDMTTSPAAEPMALGAAPALAALRQRLAQRGVDLDAVEPEPADSRERPEDVEARLALQAEHKRKRWTERLPIMYADASLDDLDDAQHAVAIRDWTIQQGPRSLVLAGTTGSGKTHAAYAVGNALVSRGAWVEAWRVHDLLQAMRPDGDRWAQEYASRAHFLVLDDLGAGKASPFAQEALTAILDARLNNRLATVVTTNATALQIAEAWGDRLMDRLRYRMTALAFAGPSRRADAW